MTAKAKAVVFIVVAVFGLLSNIHLLARVNLEYLTLTTDEVRAILPFFRADPDNVQMTKQECDASWSRLLQFHDCQYGFASNTSTASSSYNQCPRDHYNQSNHCSGLKPRHTHNLGASVFKSHPRTREHIHHICHSTGLYLSSMMSSLSNSSILEAYGHPRHIYHKFGECVMHWTKYSLLHVQGNAFPPSLDTTPIDVGSSNEPQVLLNYRTIPFYIIGKQRANQKPWDIATTITVTTIGGIDKLDRLLRLCRAWSNRPISLAFHTANLVHDLDIIEAFWINHAFDLMHVTVHLFISSASDAYPINFLRNLAMEGSSTDYAFALDIDFVPNANAPTELEDLLPMVNVTQNAMLVVPAFQHNSEATVDVINLPLPHNKSELMKAMGVDADEDRSLMSKDSKYEPFHLSYFVQGHGPTDFERWYNTTEPYSIEYEYKYEPYVVVNRFLVPRYWEMFRGRGWNKFSWILELSKLEFQFTVAPKSFLIHIHHHVRKGKANSVVLKESEVFQEYLQEKYHISD